MEIKLFGQRNYIQRNSNSKSTAVLYQTVHMVNKSFATKKEAFPQSSTATIAARQLLQNILLAATKPNAATQDFYVELLKKEQNTWLLP